MVRTSQFETDISERNAHAGEWLARLSGHYAESEIDLLRRVLEFTGPSFRDRDSASGEPQLHHALGTATILAELKLDVEALAAALLAPCLVSGTGAVDRLRDRFGAGTAELAEGVARTAQIEVLSQVTQTALKAEQQAAQLEGLRKMLLAMVQDIRVVLVKLADHTQTLRHVVKSQDDALRRTTARLAQDIFAPLANRLGVWQLKWEMEDLAFRLLEAETYARIARQLDGKRLDRERFIAQVIARLQGELMRAGIAAEVSGRPKHIFSIYKKMHDKGIDFEALYDVRAVRVLVQDIPECYAALGLVHDLWAPLPGEFDDYIARPKSNGYRSLHTTLVGPEGKTLEVQIRTHEMHRHSELGVAAHWRYKEGSRHEQAYDRKIAWLRQILEWRNDVRDAGELAAQLRTGALADTVYVVTPQGKVVNLPAGATPIDFAYQVHTELGHRCRGAKVDGAMVPLNTGLASGQKIEILAARQGGPSRDWLNPALGYVRSAGARAKIRQWFNRRNHEADVAQGRAVVEKELQRQGMTRLNLEKLAAWLGFPGIDDTLAAAGRGEIGQRQLQSALRALDPRTEETPAPPPSSAGKSVPPASKKRVKAPSSGVLVVGVDRVLTVPAKCCEPTPPAAIVGFVTRRRGVTLHRTGCACLRRLDPSRLVATEWSDSAGAAVVAGGYSTFNR